MAENTVGNLDYKCFAQSLVEKRYRQTIYNPIDSEVSAELILKSLQP